MTRWLPLILCTLTAPALAGEAHKPYGEEYFEQFTFRAYEHGLHQPAPDGAVVIRFGQVDRNHNHIWDSHEIAYSFGPAARDVILSFDANADGRVSLLEFRAYDDGKGGPDGVLWEYP